MATQTADFANAGILPRLGQIWAAIASGVTAYGEARSRSAEFQTLDRKSDKELAEMGLKREDIARHVYRDMFYL